MKYVGFIGNHNWQLDFSGMEYVCDFSCWVYRESQLAVCVFVEWNMFVIFSCWFYRESQLTVFFAEWHMFVNFSVGFIGNHNRQLLFAEWNM